MTIPSKSLVSAVEAEGSSSRTVGTGQVSQAPSDALQAASPEPSQQVPGTRVTQYTTDPTSAQNRGGAKVPRPNKFFSEAPIVRVLDAMVKANGGKPVAFPYREIYREDSPALDIVEARRTARAFAAAMRAERDRAAA